MRGTRDEAFMAACLAAAIGGSAPAAAHEVVTGWEGASGRGYAFVAPGIELGRADSLSWHARGTLSYLYYDFPEAGGDTRVRSPGQSLALALRYSAPGFSVTVAPGYEVRQTRRRTAGGERKERERGAIIDANAFIQATPRTVVSLLGSYGEANEYFWARAGVKQALGAGGWHAGVELTTQGNDDVKARQAGAVLELAMPQAKASLQFRAGYSRRENPDGSRESEPYLGVGYYRAF